MLLTDLFCNTLKMDFLREVFTLCQKQIEIADMQCWVFCKAQKKWNISPYKCAQLFKKHDLLGYISECYDLLHVSSYECALEDVERILRRKGVSL